MDDIFTMLGIDKLDESKQNDIKTKFNDIVDLKVDEKVKDKEAEIKEQLTETYEEKFETYKNDITEKFSNFVDEVIEEELSIPDSIKEYARKGELYEDVIETLKTRIAIDEGHMDSEAKDLLKECKTEINTLKEETNGLISENHKLKGDAKEFAANIYLREKCDELTLPQKEKAFKLLEGVTDTEEIDRKLNIITESNEDNEDNEDPNLNEDNEDPNLNEDTNTNNDNKMMSFWAQNI